MNIELLILAYYFVWNACDVTVCAYVCLNCDCGLGDEYVNKPR